MRHTIRKAVFLSSVSVGMFAVSAHAGDCNQGWVGPECQPTVIQHGGANTSIDPMHVYSQRPMNHLRSIQYLGTPSVNVMRIHGQSSVARLDDRPVGFTDGCTPESTMYCRTGAHVAAPAPQPMPMMQPPVPQPMPMMVQPAPMIAPPAPVQPVGQVVETERVVYVGGGYDPSKFIPRTYGSNELTPGIAHIPTSIVDRSHENAHAVLNSGMTQAQPLISGGTVPHPSMVMSHSMHGSQIGTMTETVRMAPETQFYPGSMSADGTYYEQVSGPTTVGGMQATQIICKREAPVVNVERPIYSVPTPVHSQCTDYGQSSMNLGPYTNAPMAQSLSAAPVMAGSSRYGH